MITPQSPEVDWNAYNQNVVAAIGTTYGGRPLILPDTPIEGGVLYYGTPGEAIVVDPAEYPEQYERLYENTIAKATREGIIRQESILRALAVTVKSSLKYSMPIAKEVVSSFAQKQGFEKPPKGIEINLGYFLQQGFGVCRHHAPAAGWLLERVIQEGKYAPSHVSIDSNSALLPGKSEPEGHTWLRTALKDPNNVLNTWVVDCTAARKDVVLPLSVAWRKPGVWPYVRPSDALLFEELGLRLPRR